jgi:hypothetical protein
MNYEWASWLKSNVNRKLSLRSVTLSLCPERSRRVVEGGVEKREPCQFECRRRRCIENQLSNFKL